jgi:glycosyltransferase involved in cell wall biosynthesis
LNEEGVPSSFYALESSDFALDSNEFIIKRSLFARVLSAVVVRAQAKLSSKILFSLVSTRAISKRNVLALAKTKYTVFHIHNWYNLIPESQIYEIAKSGFPVVVTLHDQRLLTGGCHYTFDCTKFTNGCSKCPTIHQGVKWVPERVFYKRKKLLSDKSEQPLWLTYISPSRWMWSESMKSNSSSRVSNVFIPNVLGPSFKATRFDKIRIPGKKLRIGIASMDPNSYVKGGDIVLKLRSIAKKENSQFELLFLIDFSLSPEEIRVFWNQIDYLLVSSRADNSPNVIHEAHHYGVPVIASQVGGISELLITDFDHPVPLERMSASNLESYFRSISSSELPSRNIEQVRSEIRSYSNGATQAHINLYTSFFKELSSEKGKNEHKFHK